MLLASLSIALFACAPKSEQKSEFIEMRLHRWTGLEGGEIFVLRFLDGEWSATLMGDGERFSCLYQRSVRPKSDWNQLWNTLLSKGIDNVQDGVQDQFVVEDGSGFNVEVVLDGKLRRMSLPHPEFQQGQAAKQILEISDVIGREFQTPVFVASYDRGSVGEYLINNCKELRK